MPPLAPKIVVIHAERTMDKDGNLIYRALHIAEPSEEVTLREAAKLIGLSVRQLTSMCQEGVFKTAFQPGGPRGRWYVSRREVLSRRAPGAE